jgi:hypothetical protein
MSVNKIIKISLPFGAGIALGLLIHLMVHRTQVRTDDKLNETDLSYLDLDSPVLNHEMLNFNLYNGSGYILKKVRVGLSVRTAEGYEYMRRSYEAVGRDHQPLPGNQSAPFQVFVGIEVKEGESWECKIVGAEGEATGIKPFGRPNRADTDKINLVLADQKFWDLAQDGQLYIMRKLDWDFAAKNPEEQKAWLDGQHEKYLHSLSK